MALKQLKYVVGKHPNCCECLLNNKRRQHDEQPVILESKAIFPMRSITLDIENPLLELMPNQSTGKSR